MENKFLRDANEFNFDKSLPNVENLGKSIGMPPAPKTDKDRLTEWNEKVFKESPARLVTKVRYDLYKFLALALTLWFIASGAFLLWQFNEGGFNGLISSNVTSNTNNQYEFNPTVNNTVSNDYENKFNNSFEFNFNIDKSLLDKYCNSTT